ncbi:hypothetical protein BDZ94DRAFT_704707 [Collybia nuda]|uniref:Uncharacterized protein n=1 Tax=Collybia nuda TaxID=64659 RepID=A0A9P5Y3N8_9AGAR|nr:hypothetical protein BDZ94DRAFT_704707 [Collybia nuda]
MHEPLPVPELFQYGKIIVGLVFIFFLLTLPPSYFFWAIFLSIFILYEPTRWRLQYYIWEINSFGQVPGRFTVVLTSNDAIHIYCPEAKFLISRLAIRVFGPLSDPKSTLNYVAWRTCLAFAKDFEPQQICPGRQEIANYFNSTPPYIHVKPFLAGLVRGVVNEGEGAPNGMALNEAFVEEYMHVMCSISSPNFLHINPFGRRLSRA